MSIALLTLAAAGTVAFALATVLGYSVPGHALEMKRHFLLSLTATTVLVMAHSFIMFFLIATGVEMKAMEKEGGWGDSFRRRIAAMKGEVFPVMTLAILLVMANFILGAAAHTRALPAWTHEVLAWTTLLVCLRALYREWSVIGSNNRLIEEAGRRRTAKS